MSEELNPIKDHLFEYIKKSDTIPKLISEKMMVALFQRAKRISKA